MDLVASIHKKAIFIEQQKASSLQLQIQVTIHAQLLQESDHRLVSPGVIRSIVFEVSHLLFRYRAWHSAPLLAELIIDFLNSEYLLPHTVCTQLVEACMDSIHHYSVVETEWDAEAFDQEFLEHLFLCSIIASDDETLSTDIGFGRNVIELLKSALVLDQNSSTEDAFQFAPELATRLHTIMQKILDEAAATPGVLDLYKLKNQLQRDPYLRKSGLDRSFLERTSQLLQTCGAHGASLTNLKESMQEQVSPTQQELALLIRNGLLFEEPRRAPREALYQLTRLGFELTSQNFAATLLASQSLSSVQLGTLPALYQAALVQLAWERNPHETQAVLLAQAGLLSLEALKLVIDACKKKKQDESLLELFKNLLHNRAHAWIRAEICHALPLPSQLQSSQILLESLAEKDPSPMVRSAARTALKRKVERESMR